MLLRDGTYERRDMNSHWDLGGGISGGIYMHSDWG